MVNSKYINADRHSFIDERYTRYIPKKMLPYLIWLDRQDNSCDNSHCYFATFKKDGKEYPMEVADTVGEITWNCKQVFEEMGL